MPNRTRARAAAGGLAVLLVLLLPAALGGCGGTRPAARSAPRTTDQRSTTTQRTTTQRTTTPPVAAGQAAPPATSSAPASTSAAPDPVEAALARMTPQQRIASLFLIGVPLTDLTDAPDLVRAGVGGVFLSGRSTASAASLAATTAAWRAAAPGPVPWVACDQEGGLVQTLRGPGFPAVPTAVEQGRLSPASLAGVAGGMGASLAAAGVDLDLAPVADVVPAGTEHANAPIGAFSRQYGSTPEQVTAAAGTVVDGLAAHGVTATLKHFPGLGRVTGNTDTTAGVTDSVTTAADPQIAAFGALAHRPSSPFVMVSLATYTALDPAQPAAFSPAVVTGLLRGQLGYGGVVVSDDLGTAKAVADVPVGDRAVRFLDAGGTLVLTVDRSQLPAMEAAVTARAAADPAFAARVDTAVRTDLAAKARAGLLGS